MTTTKEEEQQQDGDDVTATEEDSSPQSSDDDVVVTSSSTPTDDDDGNDHAVVTPTNDSSSSEDDPQEEQKKKNNDTSEESSSESSCVQVAVRVRPLLALEGDDDRCIKVHGHGQHGHNSMIQIGGDNSGPRFTFDHVFDEYTTQQILFDLRVSSLVDSCLVGYNATILAYGQTGSGKTYTIMGPCTPTTTTTTMSASPYNNSNNNTFDADEQAGVIPRALTSLFQKLQDKKEQGDVEYQVSVQFLELYGEEIRDLLSTHHTINSSNNKLTIRDLGTDEPEVVGATQQNVQNANDALQCLSCGMLRRVTGATAMNESSSRSHAIFSVCIEQSTIIHGTTTGTTSNSNNNDSDDDDRVQVVRSKFNFVDLAGAERQKRTMASGKRLQEGIDINKGLSNLGNVISALGDPKKRGRTHVPYRDAKLTRLLKGSLGGNHKTLMIACVSPASANMGESLNCLRYANRAKNIQNKAIVNVDPNTRKLQELQNQVQCLASDLLRSIDGETISGQFTREMLSMLSKGKPAANGKPIITAAAAVSSPPATATAAVSSPETPVSSERFVRRRTSEEQLNEVHGRLLQSQQHHDAAEEELHTIRAQNTRYEAMLETLTAAEKLGGGDDGGVSLSSTLKSVEKAFDDKATKYEQEISKLRSALRAADSKLNRLSSWDHDPSFAAAAAAGVDDTEEEAFLEQEQKQVDADRVRLRTIRTALSPRSQQQQLSSSIGSIASSKSGSIPFEGTEETTSDNDDHHDGDIDKLAQKYLSRGGYDEDGDGTEGQQGLVKLADSDGATEEDNTEEYTLALDELSRSIEMKERLIEQIKRNKERELMMRKFYEEKLDELKHALAEKQNEREELLAELENAKERNSVSDELQNRLREKEEQINALQKLQKTYKRQTVDTGRTSKDVARLAQLKNEVKDMKKRKADIQKELKWEKRQHLKDVEQLKKEVVQKDREINKIQKQSNQRQLAAERAKSVSKGHLEELTKLKKVLRQYKRGVGLDPVLVGKRQTGTIWRREAKTGRLLKDDTSVSIDLDSLRDYFDKKVATVVQKEATVDRLAKEWEDFFVLKSRLNELTNSDDVEESSEEFQTLQVQMDFKNETIRKLTKSLGKNTLSAASPNTNLQERSDAFLFDAEFEKQLNGKAPDSTQKSVATVLFGMIVRERRRVAALAKTASSLDEQVQKAEQTAVVSEAALRSFKDEHRKELAELEQKQQDHILSLMGMVSQGPESTVKREVGLGDDMQETTEQAFEKKLLVLANERVSVLEDQLSELRDASRATDEYGEKINELQEELSACSRECEVLEDKNQQSRSVIRQIREDATRYRDDSTTPASELALCLIELVDSILHPSSLPVSSTFESQIPAATPGKATRSRSGLTPRLKRHVELMHSSDSESDHSGDEEPAWVGDIMADIALIAEGKVPPSLNSPSIIAEATEVEKGSVFDRLANPKSFTGTQKRVRKKVANRQPRKASAGLKDLQDGQGPWRSSRQQSDVSTKSEGDRSTATNRTSNNDSGLIHDVMSETDKAEHQSVFDRLCSPSHFTGTQKERFHDTRVRRDRSNDENADRVLDEILDEKPEKTLVRNEKSTLRNDYVKQNVFDRLQKTTTHSAAVRQSETLHLASSPEDAPSSPPKNQENLSHRYPSVDDPQLLNPKRQEDDGTAGSDKAREAYSKLNVFDRLQQQTTQAAAAHSRTSSVVTADAEKSLRGKFTDSRRPPPDIPSTNTVDSSEYSRQNVFERLTTTTTEAYAMKSNKPYHEA